MKNDFRGLIVGWVEPIYVKLKEVKKWRSDTLMALYNELGCSPLILDIA